MSCCPSSVCNKAVYSFVVCTIITKSTLEKSSDSHVSSGSTENVPTVEMWTFIPTPKTTSTFSTELFCRSTYVCPVAGGCSHWHCCELNCTIGFSVASHWLYAHITWLISVCLAPICPQFYQLLILQNFWLMFYILWIIRVSLVADALLLQFFYLYAVTKNLFCLAWIISLKRKDGFVTSISAT